MGSLKLLSAENVPFHRSKRSEVDSFEEFKNYLLSDSTKTLFSEKHAVEQRKWTGVGGL